MTAPRSAPPGLCAFSHGDRICGAPATHHFIVVQDTGNLGRFSCLDHLLHAAHGAADYHPVGDACGVPGTKWVRRHEPGEGFCHHPEDPHAAAAALSDTITLETTS